MNNHFSPNNRPNAYTRNFNGFGYNPNSTDVHEDNRNNHTWHSQPNQYNNSNGNYNNNNYNKVHNNFNRQNNNPQSNRTNIIKVYIQENPQCKQPFRASNGASGYDLSASQEVTIPAGGTVLVSTGLKMAIPRGYEMQIRSRSGLCLNHSVVVFNGIGTIDSDYRGEIQVILHNFSQKEYKINKGDRIAQGVFCPVYRANFSICKQLHETNRGAGGFGQSGNGEERIYHPSNKIAPQNYNNSSDIHETGTHGNFNSNDNSYQDKYQYNSQYSSIEEQMTVDCDGGN